MFSTGHHRILSVLSRSGPQSRTDLARILDLSKASVTALVRELIERNILDERERVFGFGRPAVMLGLRRDAASFIGISLQSDPAHIVLTDPHGHVHARRTMPLLHDVEACIAAMAAGVRALIESASDGIGSVAGIGVVIAGIVAQDRQTCLVSATLGWHNVEIGRRLSELTGLPVFVENDANALIVGEQLFGNSGELRDFSLVFVSEGIGGAHIVNRQLHRGHHGGAGEMSHAPVAIDGEALPCRCGNRGCLETLAALPAIMGAARQAGLPDDIARVVEFAAEGQTQALTILHRAGTALGVALSQVIQFVDPERIVVMLDPDLVESVFARALRQAVEAHVLRRESYDTELVLLPLRPEDFASGAASLAAQHFLFGNAYL
ncbi:ROK family transcriptional regulator [Swaminathania salitolerans]|uniref:Transcriptional regulator n=1 Tax=Swaminathania salitolerans TaxID=182838 RepID=A0A511BMW7_9PROT|nr:ROK family transcriptional regulator [Swaminathania salitolerans]GBQ10195.1 ROK family protein [Swaminathania salitolerans LMG 21291]GEL01203.1 transcriptional regulator [Swaminathania salitolerans]